MVSFRLSLIEHKPMGVSVELGINVTGHRVLNVYSINWGSVIPRIISRVVFRIFSSSEIKPVTILCNIGNICNSPTLGCYSRFKTEFKIEKKKQLECITNDKLLKELAAFRLSSHYLDIELGRYSNVPRKNRLCRLCPMQMVESEYHFLKVCALYGDIRRQFLTKTAWPSVAKFLNIMSMQTNFFLKNYQNLYMLQTLLDLKLLRV